MTMFGWLRRAADRISRWKRSSRPAFAEQRLVHDLEPFQPVHAAYLREVHHPHPPAADFADHFILGAGGQRRWDRLAGGRWRRSALS